MSETDSELGDVGAERLRELKSKRNEVLRTLAKLKPMHSAPPYLYKPETIQRFQGRLREARSLEVTAQPRASICKIWSTTSRQHGPSETGPNRRGQTTARKNRWTKPLRGSLPSHRRFA